MALQVDMVYLADRVGITSGYLPIWEMLLKQGRIEPSESRVFSVYKNQPNINWTVPYANRKAPTWNPAHVHRYRQMLDVLLTAWDPRLIVTADPASLFLTEADASYATLDVLRGGVYRYEGVKVLVTLPITAWHQQVKEKDIADANRGFTDKNEYEEFYERKSAGDEEDGSEGEEDGEDSDSESPDGGATSDGVGDRDVDSDDHETLMFYTPLIVPYGKFVLTHDMQKAGRLIRAEKARAEKSK